MSAAPGRVRRLRASLVVVGWVAVATAARLAAADDDAGALFETRIRPVLVERCYDCHSATAAKLKGDLRLDTRDGLRRGGGSGAAIVPGRPEDSRLIAAIAWRDPDLRMPPKERLPAAVVADFARWVALGAADPRDGDQPVAGSAAAGQAKAAPHWAFVSPRPADAPTPRATARVRTPIDAFVLARLEAGGLGFAPDAGRRALLRRATLDLTGIPPTAEEVDAFVADRGDDAYDRALDRLLDSPRYGERWGRHWLDVARYADTPGDVGDENAKRYPYAYTYRDWVIGAFNADLPYDRFLVAQLAADIATPDDAAAQAALGFLTVGRRFLNRQPDIIDDRIDVVCRGTLGLTVSCARCHDHKFDPIPTADYYALYGVFANSPEPETLPLVPAERDPAAVAAFDAAVAKARAGDDAIRVKRHREILATLRGADVIARYLVAAHDAGDDDHRVDELADQRNLRAPIVRRWRAWTRRGDDAVFAPWRAVALDDAAIAERAPTFAAQASGALAAALAAHPPASIAELAARYGEVLAAHAGDAVEADADGEALRQALRGPGAPTDIALGDVEQAFDGQDLKDQRTRRAQLDTILATHPGSPARAMAVHDASPPRPQRIFVRGDPGNPGAEAPPRFLAALAGEPRAPFAHGSGRIDLARAIADGGNPLTARVIVNRIWAWHFGAGLVRTPSDFGTRGDPPTHPELLDWLARRFVADGWSMKRLHRLIMRSTAYRQAAELPGVDPAADPEDRLLWRFPRQRLEVEALRDAMLAVAGTLDERRGGPPVALFAAPYPTRRTIYGLVDREDLAAPLRAFDLASPDAHAPLRYETTVPQQALFLLNDPFVIAQARALAARATGAGDGDDARIGALYRAALARAPRADELAAGRAFIAACARLPAGPPPAATSPWTHGYGAVDAAGRVASFTPLTAFVDGAWRASAAAMPDPALGYVSWRLDGGHPGRDAAHAAIRRWTAPRDVVVAIDGTLAHAAIEGDGVRGRIVAGGSGVLGAWRVHHADAATPVERVALRRGDTLDFVVDCVGGDGWDSFTWAPVVRAIDADDDAAWDARAQFAGPPPKAAPALSAWEKYAQVLLMTDEFAFTE